MVNIYLKVLAVFYGYGALIHVADLLSVGHYLGQTHGFTFARMPVAWKIATGYFAILNTIAAIGLWKGAWWGVACFMLAAGSHVYDVDRAGTVVATVAGEIIADMAIVQNGSMVSSHTSTEP